MDSLSLAPTNHPRVALLAGAVLAVAIAIAVATVMWHRSRSAEPAVQTAELPYSQAFGGWDETFQLGGATFTLLGGSPRGDDGGSGVEARDGNRITWFNVAIELPTDGAALLGEEPSTEPVEIRPGSLQLLTDHGVVEATLTRLHGVTLPGQVDAGELKLLDAIFEIGEDDRELELRLVDPTGSGASAAWAFTHEAE